MISIRGCVTIFILVIVYRRQNYYVTKQLWITRKNVCSTLCNKQNGNPQQRNENELEILWRIDCAKKTCTFYVLFYKKKFIETFSLLFCASTNRKYPSRNSTELEKSEKGRKFISI